MRRLPRITWLGLAALALAVAGPVPASEDADRVLAGVQAWLDGTRDLEASFEQALVSGALGAGEVERGRLLLSRPGRMRWDYEEPERKVAIIRDSETLLYLDLDAQLVRGRLGDQDGLLPALLAGSRPLADLFVAALEVTPANRRGTVSLGLRPREASDAVEHVVLTVDARTHAIRHARVHDASGNTMELRLVIHRRNGGLPADAFDFEPPPGTEILGAR